MHDNSEVLLAFAGGSAIGFILCWFCSYMDKDDLTNG